MHASNALVCMNTSQGAQTEGVGKRDIRVIVNTYSYNLSCKSFACNTFN